MADKNETAKTAAKEKQELTPDLARACLAFLDRAQITGQEAQTLVMVKQVVSGYIVK